MKTIMDKELLAKFPQALACAALGFLLAAPVNMALAAKPPNPPPAPSFTHAYLRLGGLGGNYGSAISINDLGQVVGSSETADGVRHAFIVVPQDTNDDGKPDLWNPNGTAHGPNPLMTDLGLPSGVPAAATTYAWHVNQLGQVVGYAYAAEGWPPAGAWVVAPSDTDGAGGLNWFQDDGTGANALMIPLQFGGGYAASSAQACGINNSGQIVGYTTDLAFLLQALDIDGDQRPDTWFADEDGDGVNDLLVDLGKAVGLRGYLLPLQPAGINDAGQIIGTVSMDPGNTDLGDPFLITPKTDVSGKKIWNEDLNQDGVNDLVIKLPLLRTGMWGNARGVNSSGVVAGWSQTPGSNPHAMMWKVSALGVASYTDLGKPQREEQADGWSINDSEQIVGRAITYGNRLYVTSQTAWLWEKGVMKDVRSIVDKGAELTGLWMGALDINNASMIVGWTSDSTGYHPWIAVPLR